MRKVLITLVVLDIALGINSGVLAWTHNEHIHNNTGETINDVHKVLRGRWIVDEMMTDTFPFTGRKDSAQGTLSVSDALKVFSMRTLVAAKRTEQNEAIITDIVRNRRSNFLSTDFLF